MCAKFDVDSLSRFLAHTTSLKLQDWVLADEEKKEGWVVQDWTKTDNCARLESRTENVELMLGR